jgi:hypothetical protein
LTISCSFTDRFLPVLPDPVRTVSGIAINERNCLSL